MEWSKQKIEYFDTLISWKDQPKKLKMIDLTKVVKSVSQKFIIEERFSKLDPPCRAKWNKVHLVWIEIEPIGLIIMIKIQLDKKLRIVVTNHMGEELVNKEALHKEHFLGILFLCLSYFHISLQLARFFILRSMRTSNMNLQTEINLLILIISSYQLIELSKGQL